MSIVALSKVTLYGPAAEKDAVLDGLQSLGCLHLNNLQRDAADMIAPAPSHPDAHQALQYLVDSPMRRRTPRHEEKLDLQAVVKEVLEVRDRSHALTEEREQLRKLIADLGPWGNFELPPEWARQGELRFWFYMIPHHQMRHLDAISLPWSVVARPPVCLCGGDFSRPTRGHAGAGGATRATFGLGDAGASGTGRTGTGRARLPTHRPDQSSGRDSREPG